MNRKQKIIVSVTGIFIVLLALLGLTFAYFLTKITGNENPKSINVTTANLELVYGDGMLTVLEPETKLIPSSIEVGIKDFTVTNNGEDTSYTVIIEDTVTKYATNGSYKDEDGSTVTYNANDPTEFESNDFRYTLSCKKYNKAEYTADSETAVSTGDCDGISEQKLFPIDGGVMVSNNILSTEVHVYELRFWYIDTGHDQSKDMNKTYNAKVNIVDIRKENPYSTGVENTDKYNLAYNIINNALTKTNGTELMNKPLTVPAVSSSLETEKVLSVTADDYGTSYYFRGNVVDNYVNFAGMCWRIVRIEGDGSVKLLLEDRYEQCNDKEEQDLNNNGTYFTGNWSSGEEDQYVFGYDDNYRADFFNYTETDGLQHSFKTFQTSKLTTTDIEKLKVDEWCFDDTVANTITECNETTEENEYGDFEVVERCYTYKYYGAYTRIIENKTPSLSCSGTKITKFNDENKTDMYVGTLTADEMSFAGVSYWENNYNYYLMNTYVRQQAENHNYIYWWSLSPSFAHDGGDTALFISSDGGLNDFDGVDISYHSRPAITLKSGTTISDGEGTLKNPYIIG